ncbi:uncharacterized protein VTP21DRAFT_5533 [Calcarisporiella thermophila]|uniref:uncharacterized protein n=1 Tax=Calcarisporiella thermophila TaxID=911321 RepID=UPI003742B8FF
MLISWRLKDRNVLIVGGGEVASLRIANSLHAGARITVVCPSSGLNEQVRAYITSQQVTYRDRPFQDSDLDGMDMCLTAIDDHVESQRICDLCREKKIPVNVADIPPMCDFYFASIHRDGPLQIAVSTDGQGPKLASLIRRRIASSLPLGLGDAITKVGQLRARVRETDGSHESVSKRMGWMSKFCESWTLEELRELNEETIEQLMEYFQRDEIPSASSILNKRVTGEKVLGKIILVNTASNEVSSKAKKHIEEADLVVADRSTNPILFPIATGELRIAPAKGEILSSNVRWVLEAIALGKQVVRMINGNHEEELAEYTKQGLEPLLVDF